MKTIKIGNLITPKMLKAAMAILAISVATQMYAQPKQPNRPFGDVEVLATVPASTGFPEGIAVRGNKIYVSGPARFGTAGDGTPSRVFAYDADSGALLRTYDIQGENLSQDHANSCIAFDGAGRLYVVNFQLGIVRIDLGSGQQSIYAPPVPDLAPCSTVAPGTPCSPTVVDAPPLANDIAFDDDGNLYLTDSFQATIWRIPPGGGDPQIWFQDSRLDTPFGANGIRLNPERTKIYFTVTADGVGQFGNFLGGKVYTLPLVEHPTAAQLQVFHQYNGDAPDGIAFGKSGKLYVMLAAPFNSSVSILNSQGVEIAWLHNDQDPTFPYDSPANLAFNKHGSIVVTNHAFATMIPNHFVVLDVFVDDKESPLAKPDLD